MVNSQRKLRVMVLYGGRSGEHEVSLRSAASVIRNLDPEFFDVVPVAIDKEGKWLLNDLTLLEKQGEVLPIHKNGPLVVLPPYRETNQSNIISLGSNQKLPQVDVVFPVMHGTLSEDGTIQGLLELADLPYVGCGVLASSVAMDKDVAKRLAREAGIPVVPFISVKAEQYKRNPEDLVGRVGRELGYPVFVKPANLGSSVGIHKVKDVSHLKNAVEDAFRYDVKILVEEGLQVREIELAVLQDTKFGAPPLVSIPGEIIPRHEFYSYEAKYLDENGAQLVIPAELTADQVKAAQELAREAFTVLECEGMARVDLFLDKQTGKFYLNELNTIPGFTSISMYPKLWEYSGIPYKELLSRLIQIAVQRHQQRKALTRDYT